MSFKTDNYARFENLVEDMKQCIDSIQSAIDEGISFPELVDQQLFQTERRALSELMDVTMDLDDVLDKLDAMKRPFDIDLDEMLDRAFTDDFE